MAKGRKSLLTLQITKQLCSLLRTSQTIQGACALVGIGERTFHDWMTRGGADANGPFRDFFSAVSRARALYMGDLLACVTGAALGNRKHVNTDWKAAAWLLERQFPKDFAFEIVARATEQNGVAGTVVPNLQVKIHRDEQSDIAEAIMQGDPEALELMGRLQQLRARMAERGRPERSTPEATLNLRR